MKRCVKSGVLTIHENVVLLLTIKCCHSWIGELGCQRIYLPQLNSQTVNQLDPVNYDSQTINQLEPVKQRSQTVNQLKPVNQDIQTVNQLEPVKQDNQTVINQLDQVKRDI